MTAERKRYVDDNLGLAHSCARRYIGRGIEYDDLYQSACIGLIKAAERFDDRLGFCFSTYAVPVILGELRQLFRSEGSIKVSRRVRELGIKARKAIQQHYEEYGTMPRISDIAAALGITAQEAAEALNASAPPDSLDDSLQAQCASADSFEECAAESLALREAINRLPPQDRAIIIHRYVKEETQSATARSLGLTQVQVSRREKKILSLIRAELEK